MSKVNKIQGVSAVGQKPNIAAHLAALKSMVLALGFNPEKLIDVTEGNLKGRKVTGHTVIAMSELNVDQLLKLISAASRGDLAGYRTGEDGVERIFMSAKAKKNLETAGEITPLDNDDNSTEESRARHERLRGNVIHLNLEDVLEIEEDTYFTAQVTMLAALEAIRNNEKEDAKTTGIYREESDRESVIKSTTTTLYTSAVERPSEAIRKKLHQTDLYLTEVLQQRARRHEEALKDKDLKARERKIEELEKEILDEEIHKHQINIEEQGKSNKKSLSLKKYKIKAEKKNKVSRKGG